MLRNHGGGACVASVELHMRSLMQESREVIADRMVTLLRIVRSILQS
jgi:hypothetical protein